MLKRRLRWFVIWSSRPPLTSVYRGMYRLLIRLTALVLKHYRGIVSIYLCRGCAKNDITPGISDIDLVIVTTNDGRARRSIQKAYQALGTATGHLVDYYPNLVTTRETLDHRWRTAPAWQYRYHEGKTTWQLLSGTDVLSSLAPLTETQRKSSCYAEMNRWWLLFAHLLLATERYHRDVIMRNVTCYKAVTELLNAHWALRTGEYRYDRKESLQGLDTPLAGKLMDIAAGRFLVRDAGLIDETYRFLLQFFVELWGGFHERPYLEIHHGIRQHIDCREAELPIGEREEHHLQELQRHVAERWGAMCRGFHIVKSAFWNMEDFLLLIDGGGDLVPSVQEVSALTALHYRMQGSRPSRIFIFLRLGPVAFPLTPQLPRDLHRGLLTPATMPDVFLQLGDEEVYWTDYTQWYLAEWQTNEQWQDASAHKRRQLGIIAGSAENGHVIYPLTQEALLRGTREMPDLHGNGTPSNAA